MKVYALRTTLAVAAFLSFAPVGALARGRDADVRAGERRRQLMRALSGSSYRAFYRAIEELTVTGQMDGAAWRATVDGLWKQMDAMPRWEREHIHLSSRLVDALGAEGANPKGIVKILKTKARNAEVYAGFVAALGRHGSASRDVVSFLRDEVAHGNLPATTTMRIRVVLAKLGFKSAKNTQAILSALRSQEEEDRELKGEVARTMVLIRPGDWVSDELLKAMIDSLDEQNTSMAIALGLLGKRARPAVKKLKELNDDAHRRGSACEVAFTLALAQLDPRGRDAGLRRLFRQMASYWGRPIIVVCMDNTFVLVDEGMSKHLAGMLSDRGVQGDAQFILANAGLQARAAVPEALRFVVGTVDDEGRAGAAALLAYIADYSRLPQLQAALRQVRAPRVRRSLESAIESIRDLKSPTSDE